LRIVAVKVIRIVSLFTTLWHCSNLNSIIGGKMFASDFGALRTETDFKLATFQVDNGVRFRIAVV